MKRSQRFHAETGGESADGLSSPRAPREPGEVLRVVRRVHRDELLLFRRHFVEREDRVRGAGGDAGAAVDALGGIDVELRGGVGSRLVVSRMDAVDGTRFDAEPVFDAVVGDYVGHVAPERRGFLSRC